MRRSHFLMRWLGSVAAIALGLVWLQRLGAGDLSAPPLSFSGAIAWLDHRDTATAAFALLRVVAIGFGSYLLLITAVTGGAQYLELSRVTTAVDRITLPFAKGMLGSMALLGVLAAPPTPTPPPVQPHATDSMIELSSDPTSTTTTTAATSTTVPPAETDHAILHLLPDTPAPAPSIPTPVGPTTVISPSVPAAPPTAGNGDTWEIQHGESFWSIAADHLADVNGRPASEREIASYWHQVVELNRSRLVNPHDADLLFTGQVIELPAIAPG